MITKRPSKELSTAWVAATAVAAVVACGGTDNGKGTVTVTTWGESFIEDGLPSDVFPKDSWSVKYSKFLVDYHSVSIADENNSVAAKLENPLVST